MNSLRTLLITLLTIAVGFVPSFVRAQEHVGMVYVFLTPDPAEGGTIKVVDKNGTEYQDYPQEIAIGTEVTVTITPNPGYRISYIDNNGTEYQEQDGSLAKLLNGNRIATFPSKANERRLRIMCEFSIDPVAQKPVVTIEQPAADLGKIEVEDASTKMPIENGQEVEFNDVISVTVFEYDNARISMLHVGEKSYPRADLEIEDGACKVEYTVTGNTKIYCEYTNEETPVSVSWQTPNAAEGTLEVFDQNKAPLSSGALLTKGSLILLRATPQEAYKVESIVVGSQYYSGSNLLPLDSKTKSIEVVLTEDAEIQVQFVPVEAPSYVVNFTCPEEVAPLVTISCNGSTINSGDKAKEGDKLQFVLTENDDFTTKFWRVNGHTRAFGKESLDVDMPNSQLDVELVVQKVQRYKVDFNDKPRGGMLIATCDGAVVDPGLKVLAGKTILFSAVPADGYVIDRWLHNGEPVNGQNDKYQVIVGSDFKVEVLFALREGVSTPTEGFVAPVVCYISSEEAWQLERSGQVWQLISLQGDLLASGSSSRIDATRLPSGVYLLRFGSETLKLMKP